MLISMGPLQLSDHVVQNRQTGEQMTNWVMLYKENSNLVASASFALQFGDFVPRDPSAAKGPFDLSLSIFPEHFLTILKML